MIESPGKRRGKYPKPLLIHHRIVDPNTNPTDIVPNSSSQLVGDDNPWDNLDSEYDLTFDPSIFETKTTDDLEFHIRSSFYLTSCLETSTLANLQLSHQHVHRQSRNILIVSETLYYNSSKLTNFS